MKRRTRAAVDAIGRLWRVVVAQEPVMLLEVWPRRVVVAKVEPPIVGDVVGAGKLHRLGDPTLKHEGGRYRARADDLDPMLLAGTVAESPTVDQRGRAPAVEVDRFLGAQPDQCIRELGERH